MEEKEEKTKKTFYKKWWFWVIVIFILGGIIGALDGNEYTTNTVNTSTDQTVNNGSNADNTINVAEQQETEEEKQARLEQERIQKEQEEQEFKASCQTYTYEQMARNPENFKGTNVKVTGEVIQALYGSEGIDLRVNITKEGNYATYYTDTIYVVYYPEEGEDKILEDDIITIYGTAQGDYTYTSTLGGPITLPLVYGKYIEIN